MGSILRSWLRLDRVVAASVSEWMSCHSLTLAATPEMKKMRENWHRDGLIKCSGDLHFSGATSRKVVGILSPQSGPVVVAPDGHLTRTRRSGFRSVEPKNSAALDWL